MGFGFCGNESIFRRWALLAAALLLASSTAHGAPVHGLAMGSALKYQKGFSHFDYANPNAPKGGALTVSAPGSFDTLNPFTLKGRPPFLLGGLVFETLTENSLDEPFSVYGKLAQSVEIAPDGKSVTFRLNPAARFSDGKPVTAADVVFSFEVLRTDAASPFYRFYYQDVVEVVARDRLTVRLSFSRFNPELPLIAGQIPVLPKHVYSGKDFGRDFVQRAVGSGPYTVGRVDFGKTIRYQRNPDHWGRALNVNRGRYNFDEIAVKYYRDQTVQLEAFKAGEFDFMAINSSKQWAVDVRGEKWDKGYLVRENLPHRNNAGMQGYVFNLRQPVFQNRDVRHALALALDFEWSNRNLFHGQYTAMNSYFTNTELAARGLPPPEELALLEPLRAGLPTAVFTEPVQVLGAQYKGIRPRLRAAARLLRKAGWRVKNGVLTEEATGREMRFTITLVSPAFERITEPFLDNLRKLGVKASMKVVNDAVYEGMLRTHDFDMVVSSFGQSLSPGNEQRDFWHSESAGREGSRNLMGIQSPAVDALVEAVIKAPDRKALVTATRALDRVLWHGHYMVPHWFIARHRITYWNKLSHPETLPLYYNPFGFLLYWWADAGKERALQAAVQADKPVAAAP